MSTGRINTVDITRARGLPPVDTQGRGGQADDVCSQTIVVNLEVEGTHELEGWQGMTCVTSQGEPHTEEARL